jgi:hypothetical protein
MFIKIILTVPSTLHYMNWPAYCLAWLSAQGRTCAVYRQHATFDRYSTWNRKNITLSRIYLHDGKLWI